MKEHWQIYKSLASDLRKRAKWGNVEEARQKRFLEMAEFIETKPKFYVPDMTFAASKETADLGKDKNNLIRLPYPETVILMDTIMETPTSSGWNTMEEIRGYTDDEAVLSYLEKSFAAQKNVSHVPTVVLAKQYEGMDDIEFMAGTWNLDLKEWNPWAAKALMYPDGGVYKLGFDVMDTATRLHMARMEDMVRDGAPQVIRSQYKTAGLPIMFLHVLLSLEDVEVQKRGAPKLSVVGTRNQKKKHKARKSFDYHVLSINGEAWDSPYETVSGHGGKRSHLRRGHIRRLANDKRTWVKATYVKGSREGFVKKDYEVLGGNDASQET